MESKSYYATTYQLNNDAALKYIQHGNLPMAKSSLQTAGEALCRLIEASVGVEKEQWREKLRSLSGLLRMINQKLGASAPTPTPASDADPDGIRYVINGIDVKPFLTSKANKPITFADVVGMEKEKELIRDEFFLDDDDRAYNEHLGIEPKKHILLYGVPGTGKTFFAKAVAGELERYCGTNIPFFSVVGTQLFDSKVGASEKNVLAIFEFCKQFEHCVLYIDEFDAIARDRKKNIGDPTLETRVTTLLQVMDGFSSATGILVIAATNCPYHLDGGILSRADALIEIPLPSKEVLCGIMQAEIGDKLSSDVDLSALAARLEQLRYSNRDLQHFIGYIKSLMSKERRLCKARGESKEYGRFLCTNEKIEQALEACRSTTKQSDLDRIRAFNDNGD